MQLKCIHATLWLLFKCRQLYHILLKIIMRHIKKFLPVLFSHFPRYFALRVSTENFLRWSWLKFLIKNVSPMKMENSQNSFSPAKNIHRATGNFPCAFRIQRWLISNKTLIDITHIFLQRTQLNPTNEKLTGQKNSEGQYYLDDGDEDVEGSGRDEVSSSWIIISSFFLLCTYLYQAPLFLQYRLYAKDSNC